MYTTNKYTPTAKMSDLICENYTLLQVMSRFGLSLGFGEQTVEDVCRANDVDCQTFLAVVNFMMQENEYIGDDIHQISIRSLMDYLRQAHQYFLDFQLPTIRRKLIEAIDCSAQNEVAFLILKFFDAYVNEVRKHMDYETLNVFTYVDNLIAGKKDSDYCISQFARHHTPIETKLTELKNIIIKYYPSNGENFLLNAVLFDIFSCEQDLAAHCRVEDHLFVPAVLRLEKEEA